MDSREIQPGMSNGGNPGAESDQIKSEIDHTRERMDQTLNELGERLHPRHIIDDIFDYFRGSDSGTGARIKHAAGRVGGAVWHQIREHPVPCLLIGAGVVWMTMEKKQSEIVPRELDPDVESGMYEEDEYDETEAGYVAAGPSSPGSKSKLSRAAEAVGETTRQAAVKLGVTTRSATEKVGEKARQAAESAKAAVHRVREMAHTGKEKTMEQATRLKEATERVSSRIRERAAGAYHYGEEKFVEAKETHPLALGLGFLALGVLAGMALPRTRTEDQMIGETSDEVRERMKSRGQQVLEKGQRAAVAAADAVTQEARKQGLTPDNLGGKISHVASEAATAAAEAARQEGIDRGSIEQKVQTIAQEGKRAAQAEVHRGTPRV